MSACSADQSIFELILADQSNRDQLTSSAIRSLVHSMHSSEIKDLRFFRSFRHVSGRLPVIGRGVMHASHRQITTGLPWRLEPCTHMCVGVGVYVCVCWSGYGLG